MQGFTIGTSHARKTIYHVIQYHVISQLGALSYMVSAPTPWRREGLEIEFNHVAKMPIKTVTTEAHGASSLVNTLICQEGDPHTEKGHGSSSLESFQTLPYVSSSG